MLERFRGLVSPLLEGAAAKLAAAGVKPWMFTALGLVAAVSAGYVAAAGSQGPLLAALVLASGALDAMDGALARAKNSQTPFGAFADALSDRLGEVAIIAGCAVGGLARTEVALAALASSLLVSYARARAESLGAKMAGVGLAERAERLLIISASAALSAVEAGLIVVSALCAVTVAQRVIEGSRALRSARRR